MTTLVTGATGLVGSNVVAQLADAGEQVRALTRRPRQLRIPNDVVQVVRGDLSRPDTMRAALEGVDRIFLFPVPDSVHEVVSLAKAAGVRRIVVLSSSAVADGNDTTSHLSVEQAVEESGLEWTHVRPGEFALNTMDYWAQTIRYEGVARCAYPEASGAPVHEADVAAVATAALLGNGHVGAKYLTTGPELITYPERVEAIAAAIGREVRFEKVTRAKARADMVCQGMPSDIADYILDYQEQWVHEPPVATPAVEQVTGRPGRTFAEWAVDHASDFE